MTPQPVSQPQQPNAVLLAPPAIDPAHLSEIAPNAATAEPTLAETFLRWLKESVAALIALSLVGCLLFMIRYAFGHLNAGKDDLSFDRVKDLLLFINPLVGIVIGYYFNRVSTEARAENAERTARGVAATAFQAEAARGEAQSLAERNRTEAEAARSALGHVIPAAETLLSQTAANSPGAASNLNVGEAGEDGIASPGSLSEARLNMRVALERARAVASPGTL